MSAVKKILVDTSPEALAQDWNKSILVVDDEIEIASIYKEILSESVGQSKSVVRSSRSAPSNVIPMAKMNGEKFQFDVTVAHSAREALMAVESKKREGKSFAMGFFDVRLGEGMDGIDLVKEIYKSFPNMYAVFVTAYNDRTIDSISSVVGANQESRWDYMNKPFQMAEIVQKARNFVSLWNLQQEEAARQAILSDLHRKILESERVTSVAAVARGVAHEFGNLLMQIMGRAEISRNKPPEEMKKALEVIIDASQRAHEILDKFNHLSDTKTQNKMKQAKYMDQLVNEALDLMAHQFKKQSVKICLIKRDHFAAEVHATSLLQVMVNILINALHAMGQFGQIDISIIQHERDFELCFRDYGPGVPPPLLEKILEPFFTTKGSQGTGLGLAISREIVEVDHGGVFTVQNHPVKGFEVRMRIPLKAGGEV